MELVEVSAAQFLIGGSISEDMVGDDQNLVGGRHDGLANATPRFAVEVGGEITVFLVTNGPRRLAKRSTQPAISLAVTLTQLLPATLAITWTQPGPTGGMLGIGKHAHIRSQFRKQGPGRDHNHTWNGAQPVDS